MDQPYLPGMGPMLRPAFAGRFPRHRFYFAFRPDDAVLDAIMKVSSQVRHYVASNYVVTRENLHISVLPIWEGEIIPENLVEMTSARVQAIDGKPFLFRFDKVTSFSLKEGYCIVLTQTREAFELYNLRRKFAERFAGKSSVESSKPHVTLLRGGDVFIEQQLTEPICWTAREFVLIHSFIGQGRQEIVGRWPLR